MITLMEAGEKSPAFKPDFREITLDEARPVIEKWHYAKSLGSGRFCFGAEWNGELIAVLVFVDSRGHYQRVSELMCTGKNPIYDTFYMSSLMRYARGKLTDYYDLLVTFCDTRIGTGVMFQGDRWRYDGIRAVGDHELKRRDKNGWFTYWKPITEAGEDLARNLGLQSLSYPKKHAR